MLSERPVRRDVAMTGEVTLRGKVLEIGGVKEKVLAAYRAGLRQVIMPKCNEKDLRDVPDEVREHMAFTFARRWTRSSGSRCSRRRRRSSPTARERVRGAGRPRRRWSRSSARAERRSAGAPLRSPIVTAQLLPPPDEAAKRAQLARMKRRATGLLILASAVFVAAGLLGRAYPWLDPVRAMAEAAMVGGLADWFAVTALFRHPLGIPIPHTAIIAARKDQIGRSLGNFVQRHFLSRDVLAEKLAHAKVAEHLATWLSEPANAREVARHAASAVAGGVRVLKDEDVQALIDGVLRERIRRTAVAPLAGKMLALITEGGRHQELLDEAIALIARAVHDNQDAIRERIEKESPWWIPNAVDDKIHEKIVKAVDRTLQEVRADKTHPLRNRFDFALEGFIAKLNGSPEMQARAESLKLELLDDAAVRRFSTAVWEEAKTALYRYAERPEAFEPGAIERGLIAFGETAGSDPVLQAKLDGYVADIALGIVERYQGEVAALIAQTVAGWDPDATSQRIELAIGKDLQFIRINGTLVGGLAGLAIYYIAKLF